LCAYSNFAHDFGFGLFVWLMLSLFQMMISLFFSNCFLVQLVFSFLPYHGKTIGSKMYININLFRDWIFGSIWLRSHFPSTIEETVDERNRLWIVWQLIQTLLKGQYPKFITVCCLLLFLSHVIFLVLPQLV
jgi:hypothetical protein